jgi:hypothetical protein
MANDSLTSPAARKVPDTDQGDSDTLGKPPPRKPGTKHRVRRVTEDGSHPVLKSYDSEGPARKFIRDNYPRGREVLYESPDGVRHHYSADHDFQGDDPWIPFSDDEVEER